MILQSFSYIDYNVLNKYLESFFISRIGLRALIGNYVNLCKYNTGLLCDCSPNLFYKIQLKILKMLQDLYIKTILILKL